MIEESSLYKIYNRLYSIGKSMNENASIDQLYKIACDFSTDELNFQKAIIFQHDDSNGLFKVVLSKGYETPKEQQILKIINLLLSGQVIEYLRTKGQPIVHTQDEPKQEVESLLKSLFLNEAYLELFGGDTEIPYGLIIVGNGTEDQNIYSKLSNNSFLLLALGNFTVQLSNTINNIVFYKALKTEKEKLEENIKKRTKQINEQKQTFEAIYKTTKDGIAILDLETTAFLDVNPAYCDMTGYTKEELLRTSCLKLSAVEEIEKNKKGLEEVMDKGYITDFIRTCIKKNNEHVIVNMSISLMDDKKRILVSAKDITKHKELENKLQEINANLEQKIKQEVEKNRRNEFQLLEQSKNASMGEMIGNIAHQWRQPLSAITSTASALKLHQELGMIEEGEILLKMDNIIDKANYLSTTIDTFRNFLKGSNNQMGRFSLFNMVNNCLQIVDASIRDAHITIFNEIQNDQSKYLFGIESEISQVIINILNNAKDILKEKDIEQPWIKIGTSIADENQYTISIEDNGGGIPKEIMPKIFDPYFTTKHQSQGTGLGLHMSYRIVTESFKGKLSVQNTNFGAKFTIMLPSDRCEL